MEQQMARKLAITIAGAVSLGSYESGVMFEVLDAISQHNTWAAANSPDDRIEIDVLTGASAGGMTAAIIAQRLLFNGGELSAPYDNALYNAWVKGVDIVGLLDRQPGEDASHSLLSSNLVIGISETFLTDRYTKPPTPAAVPHPALPASGAIQLGLALSNLNGVDYFRSTASGGKFIYTSHEDQLVRPLDSASSDQLAVWEPIRGAAVACGAFPVAFRVQDLVRDIADYQSSYLDRSIWGGAPARGFAYTDGGVMQNEPLGMAKNLVEEVPGGRLNVEQRGYLFIAPHPKTSDDTPYTQDADAPSGTAFGAANADYENLAKQLAGTVIGQAGYQDWVAAEAVNDKIQLLNERADELQSLFKNGTLTAAESVPITDKLLHALYSKNGVVTPEAQVQLDAARLQLQKQYASEYQSFGADTATANAWRDAVHVFELAAGLHCKEEMLIFDFVADVSKLAGGGLNAFIGFFDVAYRKHDYDYGRTVGQAQLAAYKARQDPPNLFAGLHWAPRPIDPIDASLNNLQMSAVDKHKRQQVLSIVCDAAKDLLEELGVDTLLRDGIVFFFVEKQVKKLLAL
jgi:Patatin-like phospholipase